MDDLVVNCELPQSYASPPLLLPLRRATATCVWPLLDLVSGLFTLVVNTLCVQIPMQLAQTAHGRGYCEFQNRGLLA
jgi:hypothetical protein